MNYYDGDTNSYFLEFMRNAVEFDEFVKWIKSNTTYLEYYLEKENYLRLINTDFTSKAAIYSVKEQIQQIIDTPTYEHVRISDLLTELINQEEACVQCCRQIYEEYCNGYHFLKEIALTSICYDFNHRLEKPDNINGLLSARTIMIQEAERLLEYMKSGEIKIVEWYWVIDSR